MDNQFIKTDIYSLNENVFKLFDKDWMLLTAGKKDSFNPMTISWGTMGVLWNKPIAICFIRPQRYTYKFADKNEYFTLCVFHHDYRKILSFCGSKSGKNVDKIKETGLIPVETDNGNIVYSQARLIFECKKIYHDDIKSLLMHDKTIAPNIYPDKDFHRMFIGEIVNCWVKKV